jgi:hypothetical protein
VTLGLRERVEAPEPRGAAKEAIEEHRARAAASAIEGPTHRHGRAG